MIAFPVSAGKPHRAWREKLGWFATVHIDVTHSVAASDKGDLVFFLENFWCRPPYRKDSATRTTQRRQIEVYIELISPGQSRRRQRRGPLQHAAPGCTAPAAGQVDGRRIRGFGKYLDVRARLPGSGRMDTAPRVASADQEFLFGSICGRPEFSGHPRTGQYAFQVSFQSPTSGIPGVDRHRDPIALDGECDRTVLDESN